MKREYKPIHFAYEYGDTKLPHLKDLVSTQPDAMKSIILDYLRENYTLGCPGIVYDLLDPTCVIGDGSIYTDGIYSWPDYLANYIEKYNIPLPLEFRSHILENYQARKQLHLRLRLINRLVIRYNPIPGHHYELWINRNGGVDYKNSIDCINPVVYILRSKDASWIINPIMSSLFCYDTDNHGTPVIDGYHWEIEFYNAKGLEKVVEGWPGEDPWRQSEIIDALKFIERFIPQSLGTNCYPAI